MSEVIITVRPNGPLLVQGNFRLQDADGRAFSVSTEKPVALCRCGQSKSRPFCDGSHRTCGFQADDRAA